MTTRKRDLEYNEIGSLRKQIRDMGKAIRQGKPRGYQAERRAWRTLQGMSDRLSVLFTETCGYGEKYDH